MALYGVLADIHGNREALAAALEALERRAPQALLCLGDVVGYNADPDECVALLAARKTLGIAGNHDLIGLRRLGFSRCSNKARYSLERTRRSLAPASVAWLSALPARRLIEERIVLVHGGVRDVQLYMTSAALVEQNTRLLAEDFPQARLCFFGHSHEQKLYELHDGMVRELPLAPEMTLDPARTYFINPGSIDASRKREHKLAEFALLDSDAWKIEFWRVPYDCAATEAKAAVFGYRIPPLVDKWYSLQRRARNAARRLAPKLGSEHLP